MADRTGNRTLIAQYVPMSSLKSSPSFLRTNVSSQINSMHLLNLCCTAGLKQIVEVLFARDLNLQRQRGFSIGTARP